MPKKCVICDKEAVYAIKDSSECYCEHCAEENFDDISCLSKVDEKPKEPVLDQLEEEGLVGESELKEAELKEKINDEK